MPRSGDFGRNIPDHAVLRPRPHRISTSSTLAVLAPSSSRTCHPRARSTIIRVPNRGWTADRVWCSALSNSLTSDVWQGGADALADTALDALAPLGFVMGINKTQCDTPLAKWPTFLRHLEPPVLSQVLSAVGQAGRPL